MGIDQDIQRLFTKVMSESKSVADGCRKLGVQQGTYAGWVEGWKTGYKWSKNQTLFSAIDNAGGVLLIPGETIAAPDCADTAKERDALRAENARLRAEIARIAEEKTILVGELRATERHLAAAEERLHAPGIFYPHAGEEK